MILNSNPQDVTTRMVSLLNQEDFKVEKINKETVKKGKRNHTVKPYNFSSISELKRKMKKARVTKLFIYKAIGQVVINTNTYEVEERIFIKMFGMR